MIKKEFVFISWIFFALLILMVVANTYKVPFPIFTVIWLIIPLILVLKKKDAQIVGFNKVEGKYLIKITLINLLLSLSLITLFELITPTYEVLIKEATNSTKPDITFNWLNEFSGIIGYILLFIFSTLITIFGEELFFRGMLLQLFKRKYNDNIAIILQSVLFCLPHVILAFFMTPLQGIILVLGYGILIYGIIGGWAANKTNSIWPNLITANVNNLLLLIFYLELVK